MADFTRIAVTQKMKEVGAIPVFYDSDVEVSIEVLKACYQGGARVFEFTNRGDSADLVFAELKKFALKELPGLMLGAGSVLDAPTTAIYLQRGADFIVSPIISREMAEVCNRRKVAWIPGCGSVTEISLAHELGAEVVKIFPGAQVGGPDFVRAVKGPIPWASIMPTGGVSPTRENLTQWFQAGVHCVGIGSKLLVKGADGLYDYQGVSQKMRETLDLIAQIRSTI